MDQLIKAITEALDVVEGELLGASTHHGKRVATLTAAMGRRFGMDTDELTALTACALLHDNALTEYISSEDKMENPGNLEGQKSNLYLHCKFGQRNMDTLASSFKADIRDLVLYHHENPSGMGPFQKRAGEIPLGAELIQIADLLDVGSHLQRIQSEKLDAIHGMITEKRGVIFSGRAAEAMLSVLDEQMLQSLRDDRILETAETFIPPWTVDVEDQLVLNIGILVTRIIDYKSVFTHRHSTQIANKAWFMACHYGYGQSLQCEIYLASALHDIGKLTIPEAILEKPGKLNDEEFRIIKSHVRATYDFLKDINGFEEICAWASSHHERLDGKGYPFGKKARELDFISRLIGCIDIYQAVSEERPYHAARDHKTTIGILHEIAAEGAIDKEIVRDMETALAHFDAGDLPAPKLG
ncbi:HD family phosphohydrolase [Spirochaetia bacterium]|nr:HD family phosphohydrolase [Spirochaetia bacterium]